MEKYNLQTYLDDIYGGYPEASRKPVIGITGNYEDGCQKIIDRYYLSVVEAGGVPVIIPPVDDTDVIINTLDNIDGLILSGGGDINPLWFDEEPSPKLHSINSQRDKAELLTVRLAYNRQIPMLGICRGIQTIVGALGGTVCQDIEESMGRYIKLIKHSQDAARDEATHSVKIEPQSILSSIYNKEVLLVNSFHHQSVGETGDKFKIAALAPDGTIEAVESTEYKSVLAVQWHPEWLEEGLPLFKWLVGEAASFSKAKKLHESILTVDTHCDTPMFFPQGVDFDHRDPKVLVDLHKMTDGRQDATIMAAYLPQPKIGERFSDIVDFDVNGPADYANLIFDKIEEIVSKNKGYLSIARTPADLYDDKRNGRKSIMLGIENGLALEGKLSNVKHFAMRGVVYITLCHNGDNDICDSAKGCNTHDGVSSFGKDVIREMNDQGIMVDLSHAGEKSFYDALAVSRTPIVCSHSSCKALCDHPRNLTDDQMKALARTGGVMQVTLYHGFLRSEGEATIIDALDHLDHAIQVMGIDHVGLGTDFDGDGGVVGLADSSEMINFTRALLARKYSRKDIEKIWGGNWLRVMSLVQESKKK